jgi:glycosyltransferase involved in cell wall biosynthesis
MPYLPETVGSILGQTYKDFTFIIVDDGSTDETGAYLQSLNDDRIVLIHQANAGQAAALNLALRRCQTEYAAITDADDISLPDRLRSQVEYLDSHPDVLLLGTQIQFIVGETIQAAFRVPTEHREIEQKFLQGQAGMCHSSLMIRVAAARAAGFHPGGAIVEDIEFCLRVCELGRVANLDKLLVSYRIHTSSICVTKSLGLVRANHFASHRAACRRNGVPEPSFDAFVRAASRIDRFRWFIEAQALVLYRTGRVRFATGNRFEGMIRLTLAGLCQPLPAARRAASVIRTSLTNNN